MLASHTAALLAILVALPLIQLSVFPNVPGKAADSQGSWDLSNMREFWIPEFSLASVAIWTMNK